MPAVSSEVRDFAIVPLHAAPTDAVTEIDALYDVYLDVRQKWDLEVRPSYDNGLYWPHLSLDQQACLLVGHHVHGRFQCWLQLRHFLPVVFHPPSDKPRLPVADS